MREEKQTALSWLKNRNRNLQGWRKKINGLQEAGENGTKWKDAYEEYVRTDNEADVKKEISWQEKFCV